MPFLSGCHGFREKPVKCLINFLSLGSFKMFFFVFCFQKIDYDASWCKFLLSDTILSLEIAMVLLIRKKERMNIRRQVIISIAHSAL